MMLHTRNMIFPLKKPRAVFRYKKKHQTNLINEPDWSAQKKTYYVTSLQVTAWKFTFYLNP